MKAETKEAAVKASAALKRFAWSTPQRRWTTTGLIGGLLAGIFFVPAMGLAVFGTAYAVWVWAVGLVAGIGGLLGNRYGLGRENADLKKRLSFAGPQTFCLCGETQRFSFCNLLLCLPE